MTRLAALCRCCLLLAALWAFFPFPPAAGAAGPIIDLFESTAEVTPDGTLIISETITATVPGGGHGMFRDIPYSVRLPSGEAVDTPPEVLSIAMDGISLSPDDVESRGKGMLRVYMRNRSKTMAPGEHVFAIRYAMGNMVGFFDDHDELNWNVTGSLWSVPIKRARYTLYLPDGAKIKELAAWLGKKGSRESPVTMHKGEDAGRAVAVFESRRVIWSGEGLTCAVSWQKGVVTAPQGAAAPPAPEEAPATPAPQAPPAAAAPAEEYYAAANEVAATRVLAAFAWAYFFLVWWRYGKDPARGAVIPLFHPPLAPASAGLPADTPMSPAAVNYLMNHTTLESRGLAALLLSLAGRKACTLSGDARQGFLAAAGDGTSPYPEEQAIRYDLARGGPLPLGGQGGERLAALRQKARDMLAQSYPGLWIFNTGWLVSGMIVVYAGAFGCLLLALGQPSDWPEEVTGFVVLACLVAMGLPFTRLLLRKTPMPRRIFLFVILLLLMAALGLGLVTTWPDVLFHISGDMALPLGLALLAPWPFLYIMKAPSRKARRLMDACEGLALYIRTAETERLRQFNPPERTPELYTRLLPYAVALNLEKAWGEHCAEALEKARLEAAQAGLSHEDPLLASAAVAGAVVRGTEQAVSRYETSRYEASSSSAFSSGSGGGGGGSDSGGGGGGGGFC